MPIIHLRTKRSRSTLVISALTSLISSFVANGACMASESAETSTSAYALACGPETPAARSFSTNLRVSKVTTAILIARRLYAGDDFGAELDQTVYALDSTTIDLCLPVFPWAKLQDTKAAIKLHTLLDLRGPIPSFVHITDSKGSDYQALDVLVPEPGAFYVMDCGYIDFARLFAFNLTRGILCHPRPRQHTHATPLFPSS